MKKSIDREKRKELIRQVLDIWKDKEFVLGVVSPLESDDEIQQMLDFISSGEWSDPSDLTVKALWIDHDRNAA